MNRTDEHQATAIATSRIRALRIDSLVAVVILLIEYGLGLWVNLYATLPAADRGASVPAGFARAVSHGPAGLTIHALLGVILLAGSIAAIALPVFYAEQLHGILYIESSTPADFSEEEVLLLRTLADLCRRIIR